MSAPLYLFALFAECLGPRESRRLRSDAECCVETPKQSPSCAPDPVLTLGHPSQGSYQVGPEPEKA